MRSVILGGAGIRLVEVRACATRSRDSLEMPSLDDVTDPMGKRVPRLRRADRDRTCGRLPPACAARARRCGAKNSRSIRAPALVAVGTKDDIAGSPHELAALMPNGRALDIPDRDHMVAVGDKVFKAARARIPEVLRP